MLQWLTQEGFLDRCALTCAANRLCLERNVMREVEFCALLAGAAWEDEREEWHAAGVEDVVEEEQGEYPKLWAFRSSVTLSLGCVYRALEQTLSPACLSCKRCGRAQF